MTTIALGTVLHNLCRSLVRRDEADRTDGELLECFITRRDEDAFEALLRRHGPMVLGVCRRVLRNEADAEDAFQATFLVLVRKAATIRPRGMVGNWLYGVAHTTALKARAMSMKRVAREREAAARPHPQAAAEAWHQLQPLLDRELNALPDKYRAAIVLCDLEGRPIKEAARQFGCPPGTLGARLTRGRRLLARRLARSGVALSAGLLAVALSQSSASAFVRAGLVVSTGKAATLFAAGQAAVPVPVSAKVAALTEGVLKTMLLSKLKAATAVLLVVGALFAGAAYQSYRTVAAEPARVERAQPNPDQKAEQPAPPRDPKDEAVKAQIAKVLKAHGGEEKLGKIKTFTLRIKTSSVNTDDRQVYHVFVQPPDQAREEVSIEGRETAKLILVKNGDKKWRKLNDGEATEGHAFAEDATVTFLGPRALLRLKDPAMEVSMLGERLVGDTGSVFGDRAAVCVKLARKDGKDTWTLHAFGFGRVNEVRLYFDKDSGLLVKEEWDHQDIPYEIFYTDYKTVNGVAVARRLVHRGNGGVTYRSEVEFNSVDKLDAKLFQKP
jgi:RNA polymerase sigma factor (sigma-70 family)